MTTFNPSTDLKAGINTETKLLAYAILANLKMYKGKTYNEVEGASPSPVLTGSIVRADDGTDRLIGRFAIPLAPGWAEDTTNQLWALAQPFGTVDWPAEYKV